MRHFDVISKAQVEHFLDRGYVVIENTLTEEETGRLLEAMQRLKTDLLAVEPDAYVRGCRLGAHRPHDLHFAHILEADPAIYDYLTHPRLVGLAEELVGGIVRLEESEAIINERDPNAESDGRYGFHVGTWPDLGTYTENGLFHCTFVKPLTNLTELGPDDGGTVVVAGSHKIKAPREEITASAYEDRSLIHQVMAPAGSTLLFGEALIHATGQNRTDDERMIIIAGFSHPKHMAMANWEPPPEFLATVPEKKKQLVAGHPFWTWPERHRHLGRHRVGIHIQDLALGPPRQRTDDGDGAGRQHRRQLSYAQTQSRTNLRRLISSLV